MPRQETLEQFIERVEQNLHAEAIEEFYTENASLRENQDPPRIGRDIHAAREREIFKRAKTVSSRCIRPVLVNGDISVVRWVFRFEWLDGTVTNMEEIAYQRWEGEKIAEETFFYDPAQRVPV
jgi:hypothetical protein